MKRYVIEREMPGAGELSAGQLRNTSQICCGALRDLGTGVQWINSFITEDRIYCVYLAENEQLLREHAKRAGLPATKINQVMRVIDPLTANSSSV